MDFEKWNENSFGIMAVAALQGEVDAYKVLLEYVSWLQEQLRQNKYPNILRDKSMDEIIRMMNIVSSKYK